MGARRAAAEQALCEPLSRQAMTVRVCTRPVRRRRSCELQRYCRGLPACLLGLHGSVLRLSSQRGR